MFSPNLIAWKTPLTKEMLITGEIGVNRDLVDNALKYPQFCLTVRDNMSREEIKQEIKRKGQSLINASSGGMESY